MTKTKHHMNFKLTGISDEAGATIEEQIRAHRELGWTHLELRKLNGEEVALLPEARCRELAAAIADAGMRVAGLGSPSETGRERSPTLLNNLWRNSRPPCGTRPSWAPTKSG